jgi:gluconate 5-dehydrogenase
MDGRRYIVTGGAGHLGSAICKGLVDHGARVLCLSSRPLDIPGVESALCDVSDENDFAAHVYRFAGDHGLDGLVNNAVRAPRGIDLDMPRAEFNKALDGIQTHYFTCARTARRVMNKGGSIVNIASMWGVVSPSPEVYLDLKNEPSLGMSAAAGGILSLTRYLAVLMAPNIRVNALVPGWFPKKRGPERLDYMEQITTRVPMRRIGKAEELVGPVKFLLSEMSSYMTGQQLVVDGGYTIR